MKKLIALFAICAMVTSLLATEMPATEANWTNGGFTLPVAYTGTIKAAGWIDEGLCYNWEKDKGSIPLFLGVCQPGLEYVPCNIDMQHAAPVIQYNHASVPAADALAANTGEADPTEAYFNRARLFIVTDVDKKEKTATIQVVDLIDAYDGTDKPYSTFQFYNTVDSIDNELKPEKGRIAAFFSFPIWARSSAYPVAYPFALNQFALNQYNANLGTTDDGIGMAALIGTKDKKSWFKYGAEKYKIVSIKKMDGDLMIAQDSYTDTPCRTGAEYIYNSTDDPGRDGAGAWWSTASISLRRNDSVTKKMMAAVIAEDGSVKCIPCNGSAYNCREYLDNGMVELLIEKKYKNYEVTYLVDTTLNYIYGETGEVFVGSTAYLNNLVHIH